MTLRPRELPKRRNQLLKHLTDPSRPLRAHTGQDNQEGLDLLARHLRAAELYWVSPDMAALAVSAGSQLAAADFGPQTRPAGCGLMVFAGGVGSIPYPPIEIPIDAIVWGPSPGGLMISTFIDRAVVHKAAQRPPLDGLELDQVPPLMPVVARTVPVTAEPVRFADLEAAAAIPATILQTLVAAWLLMQQPNLADRSQVRPDKSVRGTTRRLGMPDPEVSIIALRRQYRPDDREETGEDGGRRYKHRWVVSGHWRNQPYGPGRSLRRKQWISAHVRGPDGAPLLVTEKVNVWRR